MAHIACEMITVQSLSYEIVGVQTNTNISTDIRIVLRKDLDGDF